MNTHLTTPVRLLIVDDHQIVLDSLRMLFDTIENISVLMTFTDSRNVLAYLENHNVDIVISDLHMPHLSGIDLALVLRARFPSLKILLLTMAEDAIRIREAIKASINGYILKKSGREELENAIYTPLYQHTRFSTIPTPLSLTEICHLSPILLQTISHVVAWACLRTLLLSSSTILYSSNLVLASKRGGF